MRDHTGEELIGRAEERSALRTYCMDDRMLSVDFAPGKFSLPKDFDAEEYFRTVYGVVPQTEEIRPQNILLRVDPTEAGYLKAVRLHTSQKIEEDTDSYTFTPPFFLRNRAHSKTLRQRSIVVESNA